MGEAHRMEGGGSRYMAFIQMLPKRGVPRILCAGEPGITGQGRAGVDTLLI
jgi:hypothetical protein